SSAIEKSQAMNPRAATDRFRRTYTTLPALISESTPMRLYHLSKVIIAVGLIFGVVGSEARAAWIGALSGTQNYNLLTNWAGGTIDDDVSYSSASTLTLQLTADRATLGD